MINQYFCVGLKLWRKINGYFRVAKIYRGQLANRLTTFPAGF
ncbi:MAG: hypothetical protein K0Q95_3347 [Bacteroidota bacterium]|jgi:hypothetical protein|nr:hypothetical protein [Bacteroidota bacterium]